jgi:predicted RNA-binding Zn-ribbon protein involved in translation (DUF1610 family)
MEEIEMEKPRCPCCGAEMGSEERGARVHLKCPSCGLEDVRLRD